MAPLIDDFASIATRLRELERTRATSPQCCLCSDTGYVGHFGYIASTGDHGVIYSQCPYCRNPRGLPPP